MSGCGKNKVETPATIIQNQKEDMLGTWQSEDGETYTFEKGYIFKGELNTGNGLKSVEGDFNLVREEQSDTMTLTINTPDVRKTYILQDKGSKKLLLNPDTNEVEKELKNVK